MSKAEQYLNEALAAWDFGGELVGAVRYGHGHINDTFCVHTQPGEDPCRRFILQRLSSAAFKHPEQVMANISGVTAYLGERLASEGGNPARETLTVLRTAAGELYYTDSEGSVWRCYPFIEGTVCLQNAETPELFAASGRAFGRFQRELSGYDAGTLYETIPRFHDTEDRLAKLRAAVAADSVGRVAEVGPELEFVEARAADCSVALEALRAGKLPLRVTHNDTKLNNVLLDAKTRKALCVIDLDTVMPGSSLYDFGDSIRFGAATAAEDERDLSRMEMSLERFRIFTRGYVRSCPGLTQKELELLPLGAKTMTMECGVRFLTDYLDGDHYFAVHRDGQNLDRARTQFRLVADMEKKWNEMQKIVAEEANKER